MNKASERRRGQPCRIPGIGRVPASFTRRSGVVGRWRGIGPRIGASLRHTFRTPLMNPTAIRRIALLAFLLAPTPARTQTPWPVTPAIERRVDSLVAQLTLDEKLSMIAGVNGFDAPGVARLGIPQLGMSDSPFGVRATGPSILYPGGINLAATWNAAIVRRVGSEIGRDARARGRHYLLGPGVNIYRGPLSGRNFEYYGEDPFLAARTAVAFVQGVQSQRVSATVKHFMGNNSEFARNTTDSRIDERTMREIYLPAFEAAVKDAQTGAIMGSYNLTNGEHMSRHRRLQVDVVKREWGFPGIIVSDWFATHDVVPALNGGQDIEMPGPIYFSPANVKAALQRGDVTMATIDDKIRRLIRNAIRFGWMEDPGPDRSIPLFNVRGVEAALQAAREGMVLLENRYNTLPLDRATLRTVAVIGPNAFPAVVLGGGSATIPTYRTVSVLEAIADHLGSDRATLHARGIPGLGKATLNTEFVTAPGGVPGVVVEVYHGRTDPTGVPSSTRVDRHVNVGRVLDMAAQARDDIALDPSPVTLPEGPMAHRFTGFYEAKQSGVHDIVVQMGGFNDNGYRLYVDGKLVTDRWRIAASMVEATSVPLDAGYHKVVLEQRTIAGWYSPFIRMAVVPQAQWVDSAAVSLAARADAVVLSVGYDPTTEAENWDRTFRLPPGQEQLIQRISAVNPRTIVVLNSGGAVDMNAWGDRVAAVVQAWYPGQEGNRALAEILTGATNPSGRLPFSWDRRWEENPSSPYYYPDSGSMQIHYREGIFTGYRGYERAKVAPRYPFGHGLSYTTFRYANATVSPAAGRTPADPRWTLSLDVTNTGARAGAAVVQVYVGQRSPPVPRPVKELKGYARQALEPGQTARVTVPLDLRSLAYYDVAGRQWRADAGTYDVLVGSSSADMMLRATITLPRTLTSR